MLQGYVARIVKNENNSNNHTNNHSNNNTTTMTNNTKLDELRMKDFQEKICETILSNRDGIKTMTDFLEIEDSLLVQLIEISNTDNAFEILRILKKLQGLVRSRIKK
jgi:hypothetical protein